jgi:hypothetical protein
VQVVDESIIAKAKQKQNSKIARIGPTVRDILLFFFSIVFFRIKIYQRERFGKPTVF